MRFFAALLLLGCGSQPPSPPVETLRSITCSRLAEGESFIHTIAWRSDGTVDVTCLVGTPSVSSAGLASYTSDQYGATVGGCQVVHDFDTPSGGWWAFEYDERVNTSYATYWDSGSALYGMFRELRCSE